MVMARMAASTSIRSSGANTAPPSPTRLTATQALVSGRAGAMVKSECNAVVTWCRCNVPSRAICDARSWPTEPAQYASPSSCT